MGRRALIISQNHGGQAKLAANKQNTKERYDEENSSRPQHRGNGRNKYCASGRGSKLRYPGSARELQPLCRKEVI